MADTRTLLDPVKLGPSGALLSAQIALGSAIEREAVAGSGYDATTLDLLVRLELAPDRRLRAAELCRQLQLSPSHVSRMLDRVEAVGLVDRGPDPDDRRAKIVSITAPGRSVVADFAPRLQSVLDRVVHRTLTSDEIGILVDLLQRVEAAASNLRNPNT